MFFRGNGNKAEQSLRLVEEFRRRHELPKVPVVRERGVIRVFTQGHSLLIQEDNPAGQATWLAWCEAADKEGRNGGSAGGLSFSFKLTGLPSVVVVLGPVGYDMV